jgi:hypothetical protein
VLRGDDQGDGVNHVVTVADGALVLEPRVSWWVDGHEALYVWKPVAGDFVATARVHVTGKQTEQPDSDWTLSGILVRDPASTHERESWVSLRTGFVHGDWVYEPHGDLVAQVDWFHFAPTGVPPKPRNAASAKLVRFLAR